MKIIEQTLVEQEHNVYVDRYPADYVGHFLPDGCEQIIYCQDKVTGLQSIIAIHDTTLGPAVGGVRFLDYVDEQAALQDVLRLAHAMTYKAAIAGLNVGGGKSMIWKKKGITLTEALLRKYGTFVERLGGYYITATDYSVTIEDVVQIAKSTRYAIGLPIEMGGSGDPSESTAYSVYIAMKAAVQQAFGSDKLSGKKIGIAGVGKVGSCLVSLLCQEQAIVYVADSAPQRLQFISDLYKVRVVPVEEIHALPLDIYAPCALGSVLNNITIPQMNCPIVVGAANNQLASPVRDGHLLLKRGIIHVPDFLANVGGLISAVSELEGSSFHRQLVRQRIEALYATCLQVLANAAKTSRSPYDIAEEMAMNRIHSIQRAQLGWQ